MAINVRSVVHRDHCNYVLRSLKKVNNKHHEQTWVKEANHGIQLEIRSRYDYGGSAQSCTQVAQKNKRLLLVSNIAFCLASFYSSFVDNLD